MPKYKFSIYYALNFGIISAIAPILIFQGATGKGWDILWIYTGTGSMITAFLFAWYFIERPKKFNHLRLILIAILVGIFSHWLSWYEIMVVDYIQWKFSGPHLAGTPSNPINGLYGAALMAILSLIFMGWTAIPFSIGSIYLSKLMYVKPDN